MKAQPSCDIFCRIVDNYGDIGICWRLAKQLSTGHGWKIRLWVDHLDIAKRLIPEINTQTTSQLINDIEIAHWQSSFLDINIPDIVIETFACDLPEPYIKAMVAIKPLWINLEYLSAEVWVEDFHAQASQHPNLPLIKHFFFPGFTKSSGGLLREQHLINERIAFQRSNEVQTAFWQGLQITTANTIKISLFCYPHAPVNRLLDSFANSSKPITCIVPGNGLAPILQQYFNIPSIEPGMLLEKGNLKLHTLPFLSQEDYDKLLWACDLNFVRGEDSWIRAIWAAKPFIWQPYQQEDDTHITKLDAFLTHYLAEASLETTESLRTAHLAWCNKNEWGSAPLKSNSLESILSHLPELTSHSTTFSTALVSQDSLTSRLVNFYKNRV